jgi:hemolysin activation/secretion protein
VTASAARLDYALGKEFLALKPSGVGNIYAISIAEPIRRARSGNLYGELFLEKKTVVDRIGATATSEERGVQSVRLQLAGDAGDRWDGASDYAINLMRGKLRIENAAQLAMDQDPVIGARTAGSFAKLNYQLQRRQPLGASLEGVLRVNGQAATANLHSSEKFAIGGEGRVRAFSNEEALGDAGNVAAAELQWTPALLRIGKAAMSNSLFYELGSVTKHHDNNALKDIANKRRIAGYGVSMNLGYGGNFLLSVALAWQHQGASDAQPAHGARVWAKASCAL